jgi:leader peptidase (prepilin peptidase) / N-methyltransferase
MPAWIPFLAATVLGMLVAVRMDWSWGLSAWWVLAGLTVPLVIVDVAEHRLPNRLTLPAYPLIGALLIATAALEGRTGDAVRAVLAAGLVLAGYLLLHAIRPRALGAGDVKLSGVLGLCLGWISWDAVVTGIAAGFAIGAVVGLVLLVRGARPHRSFAFGPAMLAGTWLAALTASG